MTEKTASNDSNASTATLDFVASDVTGINTVRARDIQPSLPASAVALSLAALMQLPEDVPWGLRNDDTSAFLDDETPIGEQLRPGSAVTLTPKTHLA